MTIILFSLAGMVVGAIAMYLIARNSPDHFLKFKGYADKVDAMIIQYSRRKEKG